MDNILSYHSQTVCDGPHEIKNDSVTLPFGLVT